MFFQIDDQFHVNQKVTKLARKALGNDLRGLAAIGLWATAGSLNQSALNDGKPKFEDLVAITLNPNIAAELADHLVTAGLWHAPGHDCDRCPTVDADTYLYHDWFAMGYDTAAQVKTTRGKRKELKDPQIIAAVWARDCIDDPANPAVGLCRYCQVEIRRNDRKSDRRAEMDHVIPNLYCGTSNIVLSCFTCNRAKGARTPEQAGKTLHPAPRSQETAETFEDDSPASAAAGTSQVQQDTATAQGERIKATNQTDPLRESPVISEEKSIPAGARTGTRPGRAGQGRVGLSEVVSTTEPSSNSRRKRRRSRGKGSPAAGRQQNPNTLPPVTKSNHDAGPTPNVTAPGRYGSPWHGWTGKPSNVTETTCHEHHQEQPCRFCQEESSK